MFLKVADVAKRLNCSVSTIYNLVETGRLPHHRCPGIRVSEEQLSAYLDRAKRQFEVQRHNSRRSPVQTIEHLDRDRLRESWKKQGVE